jgi:hypothetical protein
MINFSDLLYWFTRCAQILYELSKNKEY